MKSCPFSIPFWRWSSELKEFTPALYCLPLIFTQETNLFLLYCYFGFLIQLKLILIQLLFSISSPDANLDS